MFRLAMIIASCVILLPVSSWAITSDEIPQDLQSRLPEIFRFIPPPVLERLELIDLEDYAAAHQAGQLYTISKVNVVEHSGPIEPEVAQGMLGVMPGIPFSKQRFDRMAKQFYGRMIFSRLEWSIHLNEGGNVDIDLFYDSNPTSIWIPNPGYNAIGGVLLGATYRDMRYGGENKALVVNLQVNEDDPEAPQARVSWTDRTLNEGKESFTISVSTDNVWRERLQGSPQRSDMRLRTTMLDFDYAWEDAVTPGDSVGSISVGAGIYDLDYHLYSGNPSGSPRAAPDQDGTAGFCRLRWYSDEKDHVLSPRDGHSYTVLAERHFGDFEFVRLNLDLRQYYPAENILGFDSVESCMGSRNDVRSLMPAASLGIQLQANMTNKEVPFSFETSLSDPDYLRGIDKDTVVGSKLFAARGEYRFATDRSRDFEVFIFTDHAWLGESMDQLESFSSVGSGCLFEFPGYAGMQAGAYFGTSLSGGGDQFGMSFGYQF